MPKRPERSRPLTASLIVGVRVRRLREDVVNISQDTLGARMKKSGGHVSLIENGKVSITLETLQAIADAFGVTPACFFDPRWDDALDRQILSEGILSRLATEGPISAARAASLRRWAEPTGRGPITRDDWIDASSIPPD